MLRKEHDFFGDETMHLIDRHKTTRDQREIFLTPVVAGLLGWNRCADDLVQLVNSKKLIKSGSTPFAMSKVLLADRIICINELECVTDSGPKESPGTVLAINESSWEIALVDGVVRISGFFDRNGQHIPAKTLATDCNLFKGCQLPIITSAQSEWLSMKYAEATHTTLYWSERLVGYVPSQLFSVKVSTTNRSEWAMTTYQRPLHTSAMEVLAAWLIYIARHTQNSQVYVGWDATECCNQDNEALAKHLFAKTVPFLMLIDLNDTFSGVMASVEKEYKQLVKNLPCLSDIITQHAKRSTNGSGKYEPSGLSVSITDTQSEKWSSTTDSREAALCANGSMIKLQIDKHSGAFRWIYDVSQISEEEVNRISSRLSVLLASRHQEQTPVGKLDILPKDERELLLHTWNQTAVTYPSDKCLHQLFEEQVTKNSDAIAVECDGDILSYAALNAKANRLAHYLIQQGVRPDTRVGLCMGRGTQLIVGLLGILKAGGAYVPLDPSYSSQRLIDNLYDADPLCLVADSTGQKVLGSHQVPIVDLEQAFSNKLSDDNPDPGELGLTSSHLVYVMYTSGSTGKPKGVMVEHRNATNHLNWAMDAFTTKDLDHTLCSTPISSGISTFECFTPLLMGKTIHIVPNALSLTKIPSNASLLNTVPSAVNALLSVNALPSSLSSLKLSGEPLHKRLIDRIFTQTQISRIYHVFGSTEAPRATWHKYESGDAIVETIGKPIANARIYLLDSQGEPVPLGAEGELYVGGAGVTRGYLNRLDLTAERFLPDPFIDSPGARMYRTGDRARYLPDGNLIYLGRIDHQVKIRGFRVEPGEIEARLVEHPQVREAVVVPRNDGSDARLVAYVVANQETMLARDLRTYLTSLLPSYMVPAAYVCLPSLPLTPNGKLDRLALPPPDDAAFATQSYEAPQGEMEKKLAVIWRDLLDIEHISRHDNFFDLGGHSLLVVRLLAQLRQSGLHTSVRSVFEASTLAALALTIRHHQADIIPPNLITANITAISPAMLPLINLSQTEIDLIVTQVPGGVANIQDIYGLTPLQHGILFHHMMAEKGDPYLLVTRLHFTDRASLDRYASAQQQVIERHDILRTSFIWEGLSEPAQTVWRQVPSLLTEVTMNENDGPVLEQLTHRFNSDHYKLQLTKAPLLRLIASPTPDGSWVAIQLMHHIIGDDVTAERLNVEVNAFAEGESKHLPTSIPFRHVVAQTRLRSDSDADVHFFSKMLSDIDSPTLPFGLTNIRRDGTEISEAHLELAQPLKDKLRAHARRLRISLASLCHLAWAQVLARTSACENVVFGTVLFGRFQAGEGSDNTIGLLINTLPLRLNMDDTTVIDAAQHTHSQLIKLLTHEHASLALAQRCSGIPADMPLFSALLNYRHRQQPGNVAMSPPGITILSKEGRTSYPLTLSVDDDDDALCLSAQVTKPFSAARICGYMEQSLASLSEALQNTPQQPVRSLTVIPPRERNMLLNEWNQTTVTYTPDQCLHQVFEEQVTKNENAIAVECDGDTLTYAALNAQANRLAHYLIQQGVRPDTRVGLSMCRSTSLVVAILGILKAGGAYVPLDPAYPSQRLINILQDANPLCLVADSTGREVLGEHEVPLVDIDQALSDSQSDANIDPSELGLTPSHLAYVIYTSGSTGKPKGVMVEHQQVVRLFESTRDKFNFNEHDKWCLFHSYSFDVSVWELWGAFYNGCQLAIVPYQTGRSAHEFYEWMCNNGITVLNQTPSAFKSLLQAENICLQFDHLRYVIFAGEQYDPVISKIWNQKYTEFPTVLINLYGTTETTVHATFQQIETPEDVQTVGRPLSDLYAYILDSQGEPVPLGAEGELYIGGAGVTRGYLNRPDLTAERFLPNPFSDCTKARMYRTGDRARYLPDGKLVYLGRIDQQVKIRGFRIEPGEIEAHLVEHPRVREAVVVPRSDGSDIRLVAYVVASPDISLARDLRTYLASLLPDYMVPVAYVCLTALPLTSNGKLDHQSLPAPDDEAFASQLYEAPQGEMEKKLASIWRELLGIDRISRHDNFFELGGHSLLVVRLLAQLRRDELETSVRAVFETPTLAALAGSINRRRHDIITPPNLITTNTTKITPDMLPLISLSQKEIDLIIAQVPGGISNIQDIYALMPLQHGILFHHMMAERGDPYLTVANLHFNERAALDRYASALQQVIERHDILRTSFIWEGLSEPAQIVWRQVPSLLTEITLDEKDGPVNEQLENRFSSYHFRPDLTKCSLLRLIASQMSDGSWAVVQLMHHIIGDNDSADRLYAEVQAVVKGDINRLATPIPFRHMVAQARQGNDSDAHSRFFNEMLADIDSPTLPFGLTNVRQNETKVSETHLKLPQTLTENLRAHARRLKISLASLCHLAWAQVLACASGCEKIVFGTVLLGRFQTGEGGFGAIGLLINTLPFRLNMDDSTVETAVSQTHTRLSALLTHENASLPLAQRCSSIPPDMPLFNALLNYRHDQRNEKIEISLPGMTVISKRERTNYPIILSIDDDIDDNALSLTAQTASSVSATRICAYMQQTLMSMADALQYTPQKPVRSLTVVPPEERDMLLTDWNKTAVTYPTDRCLHQLFEAQVKKNGSAIAVECDGETFSYAELNARANRLAHYLIQKGVRPDTLVGLCMGRSASLVTAILGILKAGGAYVPLDPAYPSERLINILQDANPLCIVADSTGREVLGEDHVQIVDMEQTLSKNLSNGNIDPSKLGLTPSHLAYVIYTSGSTGTPKGVMIEHRNVTNHIHWTQDAFDTKQLKHTLFSTSVSFDISVFEIFAPLCMGETIHIAINSITTTHVPSNISLINTVPSAMTALLNKKTLLPSLHTINLAGEPLDIRLINRVFAHTQITQLCNLYGPTETTIYSTWHRYKPGDVIIETIGRPIANTRIYVLDLQGEPVPLGAEGEMYIGGVGVARGYLNRPELTAERFLPDPFSDCSEARMYRTGDRVRYLPDGNLVYLGRTDQQVKIRGYRIEPGEIEARLVKHPQVSEAVVIPRNDGSDTRLIAYVMAEPNKSLARDLRTHLTSLLPSFMVPAAYVCLPALPLTPNGKLDHRALPVPDDAAFASQLYEAPQGKMEEKLAAIWRDLLGIERISRHDNFFELGGHSLLIVGLLAQLRQNGLDTSARSVFETPTLTALASTINRLQAIATPPNLITANTTVITPSLLPLITLSQAEIDLVVAKVPGGVANIQDIHGLLPLQQGIIFHHMMAEKYDPYLLVTRLHFSERAALDHYASALQQVIKRHDILRTAFVWEGLNEPVQVVWRQVPSLLTEITLDDRDRPTLEQLSLRLESDHYKLDLTKAPLLRLKVSPTSNGEWVAVQLMHHIIGDHVTLERMNTEVNAILDGQSDCLVTPTPFRHVVAQTRLGDDLDAHTQFFTDMLADFESPTLPFGLTDIHQNGTEISEAHLELPQHLTDKLRVHARRLRISLASLCHLAWAQVLACASGRETVMFGTVLFGRFQAVDRIDSVIGPLINVLPLILNMDGTEVEAAVIRTHERLSALLSHENSSLLLAQRCSGFPPGMPLFSAVLNYRHNQETGQVATSLHGMTILSSKERSNYPLALCVDDNGHEEALGLKAHAASPISATRICNYMQQALISLADALQNTPQQPVRSLTVVPQEERDMLLNEWNQTAVTYTPDRCLHQLFEEQVINDGNAIAVEYERETLSYAELNVKANRLAHYLIRQGVRPDTRVCLCMGRSTSLVAAILGILKAGGTYVPLDPAYPSQRLINILRDASPLCIVADSTGRQVLGEHRVRMVDMEQTLSANSSYDDINPSQLGLTPCHLAYVMYTSGSTGAPKGVMIEHRAVVNHAKAVSSLFHVVSESRILQFASCSFDASVSEIVMALTSGGRLCIPTEVVRRTDIALLDYMTSNKITHATLPPAIFRNTQDLTELKNLKVLVLAGEKPTISVLQNAVAHTAVYNGYGPTETTIGATYWSCSVDFDGDSVPIGRPIANTRIYLLNSYGEPVPLGAEGELYIGGAGVARGYLNRPDLTAERFLPDPFSGCSEARMYRTGDRARYLPDGNLVYIGRTDEQMKIRGYRIEPGEIEARLLEHPQVSETVVVPRNDGSDTILVAYVVAESKKTLARDLRTYLTSLLPSYMVPAAYVCLPSLPLTPNGKLDRLALPPPNDAAFATQSYEALHGEMEEKLAGIWRNLLSIERISRHDNFFELGGHSLLAMQLANHAQLRNLNVDTRSIFSFPILKDLAERMTENFRKSPYDTAIPARQTGDQSPIFFLPDGLGDISYAFALAHEIDKEFPVYVLPWPSPKNTQPASIEEFASAMIPLIRNVRPNGTCAIIGYSAGGLLAYEITNQLLDRVDYSVVFLGLIDTSPPAAINTSSETDESIQEAIKMNKDMKSMDIEKEALLSRQRHHYLNLCTAYEVRSIPCKVHLFKANECSIPGQNIENVEHTPNYLRNPKLLRGNPMLGWEKYNSVTDFHVISVAGDHWSMMSDPRNRTSLGEKISHLITQVEKKKLTDCKLNRL